MKLPFEQVGVLLVVLLSFALSWNGLFQDASYLLPSYDNALLHSGRMRFIYDTGHWIPFELVFGGVTPSYHVPAYASLVAGFAELSGLSWIWGIRAVALLFSVLLPLGFFLLAKRLSNWQGGVAAAFFALLSPGLMTWGTRTSAISLGVLLVVYLLYFMLEKNWFAVLSGVVVLAMTHPPSLLAFFATCGIYALTLTALNNKKLFSLENVFFCIKSLPFLGALVGFLSYLAWHIYLTGTSCLTFKCLPQFGAREFGASIDLFAKTSNPTYAAGYFGVLWLFLSKQSLTEKAFMFSWLAAGLLLVKNDLFGFGVFTERFLTFLEQSLAVSGGLLVGLVFSLFVKQDTEVLENNATN